MECKTDAVDSSYPIHIPQRYLDCYTQIRDAVREGDTTLLLQEGTQLADCFLFELAPLGHNVLKSSVYRIIGMAAAMSELCIHAGVPADEVGSMFSAQVRLADACQTLKEASDLFVRMLLAYCERIKELKNEMQPSLAVRNTIAYINTHIMDKFTISELAQDIGYNRSYLSHLFKTKTGKSIHDYILEQRIEKAKNLLHFSDLSGAEIAEKLCFSSQSHFCMRFKEIVGVSPKQFRLEKKLHP